MSRLILFNKPYRVMSQFSASGERDTLASHIKVPGVYPAGRLDYDSEGLLLLTDDGALQARISQPRFKLPKIYLVQVEGNPGETELAVLRDGIDLKDGPALPAQAKRIEAPVLWPRNPPVRERKNVPDSWVSITLTEGRNRQVRRMLAAIGFPVLRLVRWQIGDWTLDGLAPGQWREINVHLPRQSPSAQRRGGPSRAPRPTPRRSRR